jgi:hypothetical protein
VDKVFLRSLQPARSDLSTTAGRWKTRLNSEQNTRQDEPSTTESILCSQSGSRASFSKNAEALVEWHNTQSRQLGLFARGPAEYFAEAWTAASAGAGFSEVSRLFLARFTERYLRYFLEREASAVIRGIDARERFSERLRESVDLVSRYAFETSRIAQSFAAGWFNKYARDRTPSNTSLSAFLRVAFEKLREELKREAFP